MMRAINTSAPKTPAKTGKRELLLLLIDSDVGSDWVAFASVAAALFAIGFTVVGFLVVGLTVVGFAVDGLVVGFIVVGF